MKKLLALVIVMILISTVAYSEDLSTFISMWNAYGKYHPSVQISEEAATVKDNSWVFVGDNWKMIFSRLGDEYMSIGIYAEDFETLVANSATMAMMVVDDTKEFSNFLGYLVRMYFDAKADLDVLPYTYGGFTYTVSKVSDGYMLIMKK